MDIFAAINAGKYNNTLPYARRKQDPEAFERYRAENARLGQLFEQDLRAHLGMEAGPAFDALFHHAWEKGHSSGFSEVAIEASDAADLVHAGAAAERARIRRELLAEIASLKAAERHFLTSRLDGNGVMTAAIHEDDLRAALDRILPEGE